MIESHSQRTSDVRIAELLARVAQHHELVDHILLHKHDPKSAVGKYEQARVDIHKNDFVSPADLVEKPELMRSLVTAGLKVVYICYHGQGHSVRGCKEANDQYDLPAVRLSGGIDHLEHHVRFAADQHAASQHIIDQLSVVPWVVVQVSDCDRSGSPERQWCAKFLEQLEACCAKHGTKYCRGINPPGVKDPNYQAYLALCAGPP